VPPRSPAWAARLAGLERSAVGATTAGSLGESQPSCPGHASDGDPLIASAWSIWHAMR
jgi:hypothetical protein